MRQEKYGVHMSVWVTKPTISQTVRFAEKAPWPA